MTKRTMRTQNSDHVSFVFLSAILNDFMFSIVEESVGISLAKLLMKQIKNNASSLMEEKGKTNTITTKQKSCHSSPADLLMIFYQKSFELCLKFI